MQLKSLKNTADEMFEKAFYRWYAEKVANGKVSITVAVTKPVIHANQDAWKTSPDYEYVDKSFSVFAEKSTLFEYMEEYWMNEIGIEGAREIGDDEEFAYSESRFVFDKAFEKWKEEQQQELSKAIEER